MIPLSHDRTSEVAFGINTHRQGLLCRASTTCNAGFIVKSTAESMAEGVLLRNQHELDEHGYVHVETRVEKAWSYDKRFSKGGKSTIVKRTHHAPGMAR